MLVEQSSAKYHLMNDKNYRKRESKIITKMYLNISPDGEMADTHVSGTCAARCEGSSPSLGKTK